MRHWLDDHITRGGLGYFVMGLIVLCGAVWSFGALVEIGNIATERAQLTTLPAPIAGYLFAGSVDLFIFFGYLKCYGPAWQITLSVGHILLGLITSVVLQYQHSKGNVNPVFVSVIPPIAVAVSLDTWVVSQLIDWRQRSKELPSEERPPVPAGDTAAVVATVAEPTHVPPRPRPVAQRSELDNKHVVALRRAFQTGGPTKVEQVRLERGLPPEAVPQRWQQNGTKVGT